LRMIDEIYFNYFVVITLSKGLNRGVHLLISTYNINKLTLWGIHTIQD